VVIQNFYERALQITRGKPVKRAVWPNVGWGGIILRMDRDVFANPIIAWTMIIEDILR